MFGLVLYSGETLGEIGNDDRPRTEYNEDVNTLFETHPSPEWEH